MLIRSLFCFTAVFAALLAIAFFHQGEGLRGSIAIICLILSLQTLGLWARPILDLWFDCGLIQVSTEILRECQLGKTFEHVSIKATILNRWGVKFRLYSPRRRLPNL